MTPRTLNTFLPMILSWGSRKAQEVGGGQAGCGDEAGGHPGIRGECVLGEWGGVGGRGNRHEHEQRCTRDGTQTCHSCGCIRKEGSGRPRGGGARRSTALKGHRTRRA